MTSNQRRTFSIFFEKYLHHKNHQLNKLVDVVKALLGYFIDTLKHYLFFFEVVWID